MRHTISAILVLAGLIGLAVILALAPLWRGFDALRELWPILVVLATLGVLFLLGNRHRQVRWIALAALLAIIAPGLGESWRAMPDPFAATPASPRPGEIDLAIGTHNLWGRNASPDAAANLLPPMAPDVLALQEAFGQARAAADAMQAQYAFAARCRSNRLLSNLPILASGCVETPPEVMAAATIPCDWEMPPAVWARLQLPDGSEAVFVSVHLTWPFPGATQDCQRRGLARALAHWPQDRLVIMGDFNAAAPALALSRLSRDFGLERRSIGIATFPAEGRFEQAGWGTPPFAPMLLGIDHIFAGEAWQTISIHAGPNTGSDHRPLLARLRLRAADAQP
ncbi:endonuclease/exonuclease/phosphatase family protein [Maricaulis salignorans]|uniref:endonuclease/exonuclease/phosphatase family protein n=1 Tax=Maricaulis salignorans TaxID=144026 RepID=UPI0015A16885|nr:endonuclease/exonuclease/phosphatase family protein [Maricaulis salignorans]